jgi:uncharacterized protein (DUF885 family)
MQLLTRRHFLGSAGAVAALQWLPGCATRSARESGSVEPLLAQMAEALLAEYPENATTLGLDKDARAGLKSRLTDRSLHGRARLAGAAADRLRRLQAVDRAGLDPAAQIDVGVAETAHRLAVEGFRFPYGDVVTLNQNFSYRNAPYVVAQNTGAFVEVPDFLDSNHVVAGAADAEAYLARLEAYAGALDGETERLAHDRGLGVVAPDFLLDKTLKQIRGARAQPVGEWGLVTSLERRTARIPGDWRGRATALVRDSVAPAMDRQIAELARHRARADGRAGAWKLPDGEAYYGWALRAATTSSLAPGEVHAMGLEQLAELQGRMEPLLRAQGLTRGTVGERMTALGKDPRHLFPNTEAGRAQILDYLNGRVADIRTRLPRAFATLVRGRSKPELRAAMPRRGRSTARCPAIIISTCATRRCGRASAFRP